MILELSKVLLNPDGKSYTLDDKDATVGRLCFLAILDCKSTNEGIGSVKFERAELAAKLLGAMTFTDNPTGTLTIHLEKSQIATIRQCVGEYAASWLVFQLWNILDDLK